MDSLGLAQVLAGLVGVIITGEALTLLVGMGTLSSRPNAWLTRQNLFFLILDLVCGASLIALALAGRGISRYQLLLICALVAICAHSYREWEYLAKRAQRFLATSPLFVLSNIKLLGLLLVAWLSISSLMLS